METNATRTFFAVRPDQAALHALLACQRQLRNDAPWQHHVRWLPPDNIHLTLRFLGDTPRARIPEMVEFIGHKLSMVNDTFYIRDMVLFPNNKRPTVVAATIVDSPSLARLAAQLNRLTTNFGYKPEKRKFRPHITLGRCKKGFPRGIDLTGTFEEPVPSRLEHIILYESITRPEGAQYREIARFH